MLYNMKLKERLIATQTIKQEEIDKALQVLTDFRAPHPPPTEDEVIEMLVRMKKRWGLIGEGCIL